MTWLNTINKYKRYIVIAGLLVGALAAFGGVLPDTIAGITPETMKIVYTAIILACDLVFMNFYKPRPDFIPPTSSQRRTPPPLPPPQHQVAQNVPSKETQPDIENIFKDF